MVRRKRLQTEYMPKAISFATRPEFIWQWVVEILTHAHGTFMHPGRPRRFLRLDRNQTNQRHIVFRYYNIAAF